VLDAEDEFAGGIDDELPDSGAEELACLLA